MPEGESRSLGRRTARIAGILAVGLGIITGVIALWQFLQPQVAEMRGELNVEVVNTCGRTGGGDCFLTVRDKPDPKSKGLRNVPDGRNVTVVCQVNGVPVKASVSERETTVWSKTKQGGYVSNAYLRGIDPYAVTKPCPT